MSQKDSSVKLRVGLLCDRVDQSIASIERLIEREDDDISESSKDILNIYLDDMQMCVDNMKIILGLSDISKGE